MEKVIHALMVTTTIWFVVNRLEVLIFGQKSKKN